MSTLRGARRVAVAVLSATLLAATACAPETIVPPGTATDQPTVAPTTPTDTASPTPSKPVVEPPSATPEPSETPQPTQPSADPSADEDPYQPVTSETPVVEPVVAALLKEGDDNEMVRELQHRLLQIEWFEGKITSSYGEKTRTAVEGFQTKRGFPATGEVDQTTWDKLVSMTRKPTNDEMHNILTPGKAILAKGSKGDAVKDLQARLKQIAWYSADVDGVYGPKTVEAVKGFQGKREIPVTGEVDQRTLDRLKGMTRKPTTNELNNIAPEKATSGKMTLDDRCLTGRAICISKSQRKLAWVVDGEIKSVMDVRFGSELTPTRNGSFSVGWKSRNHHSSLYDTPMPYALFFSGGQAVHYSADFAARGYNGASHGCVNVRDKAKVAALFDAAKVGDKVIVYTG